MANPPLERWARKARLGCCPSCDAEQPLASRPTLRVSAPGDPLEREADRIAEQVMNSPAAETQVRGFSRITQRVQRQAEDEAFEDPEEADEDAILAKRLQRTATPRRAAVPEAALEALGSGQPLPTTQRAFFAPRLGHDLSQVRIHVDRAAHEAARAFDARAFTHGSHIYFGAGEYAPHSTAGQRLIAHELAHTLQQNDGIARAAAPAASSTQTPADTECTPSTCGCDDGSGAELKEARKKALDLVTLAASQLGGIDLSARVGARARARRRLQRMFGKVFGHKAFTTANVSLAKARFATAAALLKKIEVGRELLCDSATVSLTCQAGADAYYNAASQRIVFCTEGPIGARLQEARLVPSVEAAREFKARESEAQAEEQLESISGDQPSAGGIGGPSQEGGPFASGTATGGVYDATAAVQSRREREGYLELSERYRKAKLAAKAVLVQTLIHEAIHHAIQPGVVDIYSHHLLYQETGGRGATAAELASAALENPDSYSEFALTLADSMTLPDGKDRLEQAGYVVGKMREPSTQVTEVGPLVARRQIRLALRLGHQAMRETVHGLRLAQQASQQHRPETSALLALLQDKLAGSAAGSADALSEMEATLDRLASELDTKRVAVRKRHWGEPDDEEIRLETSLGIQFRKLDRIAQVRLLLSQVLARDPVVADLTAVVIGFSLRYGVLKGFRRSGPVAAKTPQDAPAASERP